MTALGLRDYLTHRGNPDSSRYGWLRLTPMYSVHLVEELLDRHLRRGGRVLDPFCGTGTTALVCAERAIECDTTDINPFLLWLAQAKTSRYAPGEIAAAREAASAVGAAARDESRGRAWVPPLANIEKWWEPPVLDALSRSWHAIVRQEAVVASASQRLLAVAFLRTAIRTAHVSFAHQSMSFKRRAGSPPQLVLAGADGEGNPVAAEWEAAIDSIADAASTPVPARARVLHCDARDLSAVLERRQYSTVITSPPYCNRMSYIRELRPYMYWLGYLADARDAGDLDWRAIGGTWGMATSRVARWEPDSPLRVPYPGFGSIVDRIASGTARHADLLARYVAKYFHDTVLHARELFEVVEPGGTIHYVVGNSKFYDVVVPTQDVYAAIFESEGFEAVSVSTLRKRTSKKELFEYLVSARRPR